MKEIIAYPGNCKGRNIQPDGLFTVEDFIKRNADTYIKHSDVPEEIIKKYGEEFPEPKRIVEMRDKFYRSFLPPPIIEIWKRMGFGTFENGLIRFVNPDDYQFVLDSVYIRGEKHTIFAVTPMGDFYVWSILCNGVGMYHAIMLICLANLQDIIHNPRIHNWLGKEIDLRPEAFDDQNAYNIAIKEMNLEHYLRIKDKLPPIGYDQCYGYMPIPAAGGRHSYKKLTVVNTLEYSRALIDSFMSRITVAKTDEFGKTKLWLYSKNIK